MRRVFSTPGTTWPIIRISTLLFACVLVVLCAVVPALARPQADATLHIRYEVKVADADKAIFHVTMDISHPPDAKTDVAIPAWTPGFYQILHYEKDISHVQATDENVHPVHITHPDERTWEVDTSSHPDHITIAYDVHAGDKGLGFFGSVLDKKSAFINGASLFMYLVGHTNAPTDLKVFHPAGWYVETPLDPASYPNVSTSVLYSAKSYDELIDCPVQMGEIKTLAFDVDGTPFRCVVVGKDTAYDKAKLTASLTQIARTAKNVFGSFPFSRYTFFFHIGGAGFDGGLEHRSSTVIHFPFAIGDGTSDDFVTIVAHEFFHAWNVKYLHPAGLGPFDYTREVRSPSLWFAEGVTDYYSEILPVRGGQRDTKWFRQEMAGRIAELDANPSRRRVSLETASRKAWEGESEGFDGLSYYLKGSLVGFYFDLRIRELTHGTASLNDVMQELAARYGAKGLAYPDDAILLAVNKIAQTDVTAEYNRLVRGTDEIDWTDVLRNAGLILQQEKRPYLGLRTAASRAKATEDLPVVVKVEPTFTAEQIGLQKGDVILAINGRKITREDLSDYITSLAVGSLLTVTVQRGEERKFLHGELGFQYAKISLEEADVDHVSQEAARLRREYFLRDRDKTAAVPSDKTQEKN